MIRKILAGAALISLFSFSATAQVFVPTVGNVVVITTGGTAVNAIVGPVNGCYIVNPLTTTDEGIGTVEPLYVNPVTTATTTGNTTTTAVAPGNAYFCPPFSTKNISVNAATSSHAFVVVRW